MKLVKSLKQFQPSMIWKKKKFDLTFKAVFITGADVDKIEQTVLSISEIDKAIVIPCIIPEVVTVKEEQSAMPVNANVPVSSGAGASAAPAAAAAPAATAAKNKSGQSVRVDIDKLDALLNLVGRHLLANTKTRLEQIGLTCKLTDLVETIEQMDRVTTDLQSVVMKVRNGSGGTC